MTEALLAAKKRVGRFLAELPGGGMDLLRGDLAWHGPHPLNDLQGVAAFAETAWRPLLRAFPDLERRDDILMAGEWRGHIWIGATGHYLGTLAQDYLGIPATGGLASLRFGEFYRLEDGRIAEAFVQWDFPGLMRQAGVNPLPPDPGLAGFSPPPATMDGATLDHVDPAAGAVSQRLVEAMIAGLMQYDGESLDSMAMERFWHPKMMWYGPSGIGANRALKGFQDFHQRPFLTAFPDRKGGDHKCRLGDGAYFASTGWPSIRATHAGPYLGAPATRRAITMRVMDWWRREGGLLRENWVFIDLPDLFMQFGIDLFARMRHLAGQR